MHLVICTYFDNIKTEDVHTHTHIYQASGTAIKVRTLCSLDNNQPVGGCDRT